MNDDRLSLWIWCVMVFGVGNSRIWEMSANYDDINEFALNLKNHEITGITESEYERCDTIPVDKAAEILTECRDKSINVYCYESEGYPQQLKQIANPPAVLFCYGNLDFLNDKCTMAVIGTRSPSQYSVDTAEKLCYDMINRGIILASGFANGIDQTANTKSIESGAPAVAVCGTPVDSDYPAGSGELKKKIAENGAVISEYFPSTKPDPQSFVNRNRILVGLSMGILIVEARINSHGLNNVNHAITQGKPVFVIPPHDIYDSRYFGQRDLIRNECQPVFGVEDIVYSLSDNRYDGIKLVKSMGEFTLPAEDSGFFTTDKKEKNLKQKSTKRNTRNKQDIIEEIKPQIDYSGLDDNSTAICKLLEKENMLADDIANKSGIDISAVLTILTELELEGIVKSYAGKMFGI